MRILWKARRPNQSILNEVNPAYSLEESLILGKIEGRRRGNQRMRWLDDVTSTMGMNLGKLQEMVRDAEACCAAYHGVTKSLT